MADSTLHGPAIVAEPWKLPPATATTTATTTAMATATATSEGLLVLSPTAAGAAGVASPAIRSPSAMLGFGLGMDAELDVDWSKPRTYANQATEELLPAAGRAEDDAESWYTQEQSLLEEFDMNQHDVVDDDDANDAPGAAAAAATGGSHSHKQQTHAHGTHGHGHHGHGQHKTKRQRHHGGGAAGAAARHSSSQHHRQQRKPALDANSREWQDLFGHDDWAGRMESGMPTSLYNLEHELGPQAAAVASEPAAIANGGTSGAAFGLSMGGLGLELGRTPSGGSGGAPDDAAAATAPQQRSAAAAPPKLPVQPAALIKQEQQRPAAPVFPVLPTASGKGSRQSRRTSGRARRSTSAARHAETSSLGVASSNRSGGLSTGKRSRGGKGSRAGSVVSFGATSTSNSKRDSAATRSAAAVVVAPAVGTGKYGLITRHDHLSSSGVDDDDERLVPQRGACEQVLIDVGCLRVRKKRTDDSCRVCGCTCTGASRAPFMCTFHNDVGQIYTVTPAREAAFLPAGTLLPKIKLCNRCHRWEWLPNYTNRGGKYNLTCKACCGRANYRHRTPGRQPVPLNLTLDGSLLGSIEVDVDTTLTECRQRLIPEAGFMPNIIYSFTRGGSRVERTGEPRLKAKDCCNPKGRVKGRLVLALTTDDVQHPSTFASSRSDIGPCASVSLAAGGNESVCGTTVTPRPGAYSPVFNQPFPMEGSVGAAGTVGDADDADGASTVGGASAAAHSMGAADDDGRGHGAIVSLAASHCVAALWAPAQACEEALLAQGILQQRQRQPNSTCRVTNCRGLAGADPFLCAYHCADAVYVAKMARLPNAPRVFVRLCGSDRRWEWLANFAVGPRCKAHRDQHKAAARAGADDVASVAARTIAPHMRQNYDMADDAMSMAGERDVDMDDDDDDDDDDDEDMEEEVDAAAGLRGDRPSRSRKRTRPGASLTLRVDRARAVAKLAGGAGAGAGAGMGAADTPMDTPMASPLAGETPAVQHGASDEDDEDADGGHGGSASNTMGAASSVALPSVAKSLLRSFGNFVGSLGIQTGSSITAIKLPKDGSVAACHTFAIDLLSKMREVNEYPAVRSHLDTIGAAGTVWEECAGDNGFTLVHFATAVGCTKVLSDIDEYAVMQTLLQDERMPVSGGTPLEKNRLRLNEKVFVRAASQGSLSVVRKAVESGLPLDCCFNAHTPFTPLMGASRGGHTHVVEYLLEQGAKVDARAQDGQTPLILAARNHHLKVVNALLAHGADVNAVDMYGYSALMRASRGGSLTSVKALAEAGASVNLAAKYNGVTALLWAAIKGYAQIAQYLLERGANPVAANAFAEEPLQWAQYHRHHGIVSLLEKHIAKLHKQQEQQQAQQAAAGEGKAGEAAASGTAAGAAAGVASGAAGVNGGASANMAPAVDAAGDVGMDAHAVRQPISAACRSLQDALVDFVAAHGGHALPPLAVPASNDPMQLVREFCEGLLGHMRHATATVPGIAKFLQAEGGIQLWDVLHACDGRTLRQLAVDTGASVVTRQLRPAGPVQGMLASRNAAVVEDEATQLLSRLMRAASNGDTAGVQAAIKAGAAVDARQHGYTPLMAAARSGDPATVKWLLEQGANVNLSSPDNQTPLILAANSAHIEVVELLVQAGAQVNASDTYGSVLLRAARNGHSKVVEYLVAHGADVNAAGEFNGFTALQFAAFNGNLAMTRFLVDHGAHLDATNMFGETALHWARMRENFDVASHLEREMVRRGVLPPPSMPRGAVAAAGSGAVAESHDAAVCTMDVN